MKRDVFRFIIIFEYLMHCRIGANEPPQLIAELGTELCIDTIIYPFST